MKQINFQIETLVYGINCIGDFFRVIGILFLFRHMIFS